MFQCFVRCTFPSFVETTRTTIGTNIEWNAALGSAVSVGLNLPLARLKSHPTIVFDRIIDKEVNHRSNLIYNSEITIIYNSIRKIHRSSTISYSVLVDPNFS